MAPTRPLRPCLDLNNLPSSNEKLSAHIGKLARVRKELPALQTGGYEQVIVKNEQLVFKRFQDGQTVYIALNLADQEARLDFGMDASKVLVDYLHQNEVLAPVNGNISVLVAPYDTRILVQTAPDAVCDLGREEGEILPPRNPIAGTRCSRTSKLARLRHFKGNEYRVIGFAKHSETEEKWWFTRSFMGNTAYGFAPRINFLKSWRPAVSCSHVLRIWAIITNKKGCLPLAAIRFYIYVFP